MDNRYKDQIVLNVFEFLETGNIEFANKAKENLEQLAKMYHITIKKKAKINTKIAFKDFIINGKGYVETINRLYNSI